MDTVKRTSGCTTLGGVRLEAEIWSIEHMNDLKERRGGRREEGDVIV